MRSYFLVFTFLFLIRGLGQNWSLRPFIGNAIMVSGSDNGMHLPNDLKETHGLGYNYQKFNYRLMSPLTFGLKVNYEKNRFAYAAGIIFGDQDYSNVQFYTIGRPSESTIYTNDLIFGGSGSGLYNIKIPLSLDYTLSSSLKRQNGVKVGLHTGVNLVFYERWDESKFDDLKRLTADGNDGWMMLPYGYSSINVNNDLIYQEYWSANLNKGINISVDLGLNFDWYIKSKHWFTTSLYYEQGLRNVSATVGEVYVNGDYIGIDGVYSRGSEIHLKLLFPIKLQKREKVEK